MSAANTGSSGRGSPSGAPLSDWSLRPRYTAADFTSLLWRERWLMLGVFLALFALGAALAWTQDKSYTARASLLVRLGQEYVYQPRAGAEPQGTTAADINEVLQSEREILTGAGLRQRVIERIGYPRVFPEKAARWNAATPAARRQLVAAGAETMIERLGTDAAPDQNVIRVTYKDKNSERAALVLNTLVDEYLTYRREVFADVTLPAVTRQREAFENQLAQAEQAYQQFLNENDIGDFDAEKASLNTLYTTLNDTRYRNQAQLSQVRGRLSGQSAALNGVQPEIALYRDVDDTAHDRLVALRVQREELLTRYRPEASPVRELDRQIAQFEAAVASGKGVGEQLRRVGVNPIYQTVATDRAQSRAEAASLENSLGAVRAQLNEIAARRQKLAALEPRYLQLQRQREVLSANVRAFAAREQQTQAAQAVAQSASDNVRVVERALPPVKGSSFKGELLALSFLFALATALAVAFTRIILRRGFVTPASASRTLDLPILATAPDGRRGALA
jgi:uncharacterized protein involved in exopolysaccharide biosynthesis